MSFHKVRIYCAGPGKRRPEFHERAGSVLYAIAMNKEIESPGALNYLGWSITAPSRDNDKPEMEWWGRLTEMQREELLRGGYQETGYVPEGFFPRKPRRAKVRQAVKFGEDTVSIDCPCGLGFSEHVKAVVRVIVAAVEAGKHEVTLKELKYLIDNAPGVSHRH